MNTTTINAATFTLSGGASGSVSYSGLTATLVPDVDLGYSTTYTAMLSSTVADVARNPLGTSVSWSFTTEAAPIPPFSLPFASGRRWLYDVNWTSTVVGVGIGVKTTTFAGRAVVHVESELQWGGRSAWRVLRYDLENAPSENPFAAKVIYLSDDSDGLDKWVPTGSGGEWRRVLSTLDASFGNNDFFMAGSPRGPTTTIGPSQVTVPAGTFPTLRANVNFTQTGRFAPEDIFEDRTEHYADGVGLVRADWDFDFDDNDPAAFDVFDEGLIKLTNIDTGPFPDLAGDSEPNNEPTSSGSQAIGNYSIVAGSVAITDAGAIVNDANVTANILGDALLQDWYRFSTTATQALRLDLVYEAFTGAFNDLDVYLFREESGGSLTYVAAGTKPEGEAEAIDLPALAAGTYYVAVQAWDTPTGSVDYWFAVR